MTYGTSIYGFTELRILLRFTDLQNYGSFYDLRNIELRIYGITDHFTIYGFTELRIVLRFTDLRIYGFAVPFVRFQYRRRNRSRLINTCARQVSILYNIYVYDYMYLGSLL
jgi:hypothetical protein